MLTSRDTPPPLHHSSSVSDRASLPSRDTTPATPVSVGSDPAKRSDATFDSVPWFQRPPQPAKTTTRLCVDSSLVGPDFDENTFPLFGATPRDRFMAVGPAPDDSFTSTIRHTSTSPRGNQPSDLTAALKRTTDRGASSVRPPMMDGSRQSLAVPESSDMSRFENGARPISMKGRPMDKNRRESLAQSLGMGMSWGGASVGSWIRDE